LIHGWDGFYILFAVSREAKVQVLIGLATYKVYSCWWSFPWVSLPEGEKLLFGHMLSSMII